MYKLPVDQCDIPAERRGRLKRFREARQRWLDVLNGPHGNAISTQLHSLMYFDTAYATLIAARKLEAYRPINEMLWMLYEYGYANLIATGVRRLVDKDDKTGSLMSLVLAIETADRNEHLFTRENYVCNDGLPFDTQAATAQFAREASADSDRFVRVPSSGSQAWMSSELAHRSFDRLVPAQPGAPRNRGDRISSRIFERLKTGLSSDPIKRLCAFVDVRIAHADHSKDLSAPHLNASVADVAEAFKTMVQVRNFLSAILLNDSVFGSAVPVPQYDISAALDEPFVGTNRLPDVSRLWREESDKRNQWATPPKLDLYYPSD